MFSATTLLSGLLLLSLTAEADEVPNLPYDPATWSGCTFWYDSFGDMTCLEAAAYYYLPLEYMLKWNPSLSSDGTNCVGWSDYQSYCVDAYVAPVPTSTTTSTTVPAPTTTSKPRPSPTWIARGCYLDNVKLPTLSNRTSVTGGGGGMTPDLCGATCWAGGFTFAGVERGDECWCGNSIRNEKPTDAATTCVQPCAGDPGRTCGGDGRIEVLEGLPVTSAQPSPTATSGTLPPPIGTSRNFPVMPMPTPASNAARNAPPSLGWLA